ncbi:MAG: hypothetical protein GYA24_03905 [Candidatus Lokiarchaeota archaeon]|nr:hypothetical protein [Candidatus Lokiarchaeota archaeon]
MHLLDAVTGALVRVLEHQQPITIQSLAFSPDGTILAAGCHNKSIRFRDVKKGIFLQELKDWYSPICYDVAFSPDGTLLSSVSENGGVQAWTMSSKGSVSASPASPSAGAFSPSSSSRAASSSTGPAMRAGSLESELESGSGSVSASADGSFLEFLALPFAVVRLAALVIDAEIFNMLTDSWRNLHVAMRRASLRFG